MYNLGNTIDFNKKCHLCDSNQFEFVSKQYCIVKCSRCKLGHRYKFEETIISSYSGNLVMPPKLYSVARSLQQFKFISKHIRLKGIKTILEIGPGNGSMLRLLRKELPYTEIYAIEPSKPLAYKLKRIPNVNVIDSFIEEAELGLRFDLIILSHCLEHIGNPLKLLSYIYDSLLLPEGALFIEVPNPDFELRNELAIKGSPEGHLWFFSPQNLSTLLEKTGFSDHPVIIKKVCSSSKLFILSEDILRNLLLKEENFYKILIFFLRVFRRFMLYFISLTELLHKNDKRQRHLDAEMFSPFYDNIAIIAVKGKSRAHS